MVSKSINTGTGLVLLVSMQGNLIQLNDFTQILRGFTARLEAYLHSPQASAKPDLECKDPAHHIHHHEALVLGFLIGIDSTKFLLISGKDGLVLKSIPLHLGIV